MLYRKVILFKTTGIVEVVRKQLQNWEEMSNWMLEEREDSRVEERSDRGRGKNTADRHLLPHHPIHNSLPWSLHHQTHTAEDYREGPQKEMITEALLPLTASPLPPGRSKPRGHGQRGKEGVKCYTVSVCVCVWNMTGVNTSRLMHLS